MDVVSANVQLTKNLACRGDGLRVAESGLTIDLNGFRVTGSGAGVGIIAATDVAVTNGTIKGSHRESRSKAYGGRNNASGNGAEPKCVGLVCGP